MKKMKWLVLMIILFLSVPVRAEVEQGLSITGLVKQPLNLTLQDLAAQQSVEAQLNEIFEDGRYRGVFRYRGVPLRNLLELASIQKEETDFPKLVDLAVVVRNRDGQAGRFIVGRDILQESGPHPRGLLGTTRHAQEGLRQMPCAGGIRTPVESASPQDRIPEAGDGWRRLRGPVAGKHHEHRGG